MEQGKIALKSKAGKAHAKKKANALNTIKINGVKLILDDSLSKYANDPFFIEHTRKVNGSASKK